MVRLYGRDEAAALVRQLMVRPRRAQAGDGHCPVLVFEGTPASGKTALLEALAGLLNQRVPYAYLDLESVMATSGSDAVPELLAALAFQLARRTGRYGALRFPRLVVGHLVMALNLDWVDRDRARTQVDAALGASRGVDRWTRTLGDAAAQVLARVPGVGVDLPSSLFERALAGAVGLANRWGPGRRMLLGPYQDWYGRQDREVAEPAIESLVGLNRWAAHNDNPDNQQRIADLLLNAFLADLGHNFQSAPRADEWTYNCVVLLDNADCELGRNFLSQLVQVRRDHAAGGLGAADPLTVVATSRGDLLSDLDVTGPVPVQADVLDRVGARRRQWWLPHTLRFLTLDETSVMVVALALPNGNSQRLARMLHELTGGQPAATQLLLDVITERRTGLVEIDEILGVHRGGVTVEEALCGRLLAGNSADTIDDLVTCAAGRDRTSGRLIAQSGLIADRTVADAAAMRAGLWADGDDGEPTLLRRLLLRRLAQRDPSHPASWIKAHRWLREDADQRGDPTDADLYYAMALDQWGSVAEAMTNRLATDDLSAWLGVLHALAWAPRQEPLTAPSDSPAATARELALPHARRDPVFTTVLNLLTSLSVVRDPWCGSQRSGLYWQIANRYQEISRHTGTGSDELVSLVHQYQVRARQWQQVPTPAQPSGNHRPIGQPTRTAR